MTEIQVAIMGFVMTGLWALIVILLRSNFSELKEGQKEIRNNMVGKEMCAEKHKAIEERSKGHAKSIHHLFRIVSGEVVVKGVVEEADLDGGHDGD
jgi:Na+-translocating ferredoxin:NAD+ oxidoreductase RnfG subunit